MTQKEYNKQLVSAKNNMTLKNFKKLINIVTWCAMQGLVINDIDVGDLIYLEIFKNKSEDFWDKFEKEFGDYEI